MSKEGKQRGERERIPALYESSMKPDPKAGIAGNCSFPTSGTVAWNVSSPAPIGFADTFLTTIFFVNIISFFSFCFLSRLSLYRFA
jgi:hypothetical protein